MLIPLKTPSPQEEGCHANEPQVQKFHFNYNFKCVYIHTHYKENKKKGQRQTIHQTQYPLCPHLNVQN